MLLCRSNRTIITYPVKIRMRAIDTETPFGTARNVHINFRAKTGTFFSNLFKLANHLLVFFRHYTIEVIKKPFVSILLFPITYCIFWFVIPSIVNLFDIPYFSASNFLFESFGLTSYLSTDLAILSIATSILKLAIPLSLTFFYFSYKEQKALALSSVSFLNYPTLFFGYFSMMALVYSLHLKATLSKYISEHSLINYSSLNRIFSGSFVVWLVISLATLFSGFFAIKIQMLNLSVQSQFNFALKEINKQINIFEHITQNGRKKLLDKIINNLNSIYQLLFLAIDKSTMDFYKEAMKKLKIFLADFHDNDETKRKLESDENEVYDRLYQSILKNQVNLISRLLSFQKIEEANKLMKTFSTLASSNQLYYEALSELGHVCYRFDNINTYLHYIELVFSQSVDQDSLSLFFMHKQLLILCIEKNDTKTLSLVIYSLLKITQQNSNAEGELISQTLIPSPIIKVKLTSDKIIECVLFMIFQACQKTLELSHYSSTGLLVKFIVTNFSGSQINSSYFYSANLIFGDQPFSNPFLPKCNFSEIPTTFNFNKTVMRYCYEKMTLLIYCQQRFVKEINLIMDQNLKVEPLLKYRIFNNGEYLYKKLKKAGDKYGLLFFALNNGEYFDKYIKELSPQMIVEKEVKISTAKISGQTSENRQRKGRRKR